MIKRPININYYLKSKSIFFLWIILFFRIGFVFGQSDAPDINEVIKNKTPLEQIMELNELSRQYRNSDIESALNFCIKAYEISVEQRTENPCVPGSIPGGTTFPLPFLNTLFPPLFIAMYLFKAQNVIFAQ
jgi:hypothetical protein